MRKMIQRKLRRITALFLIVTLFMGMNGVTVSAAVPGVYTQAENDIAPADSEAAGESEIPGESAATDEPETVTESAATDETDPAVEGEATDAPETAAEGDAPAGTEVLPEDGAAEEPGAAVELPETEEILPDAGDVRETETDEAESLEEDEEDPAYPLIPDIEDDGSWFNVGKRSSAAYSKMGQPRRSGGIPSSYDARESGIVSSVKDQGGWGACWSFQAVSAAESSVMISGGTEPDLSELQLLEFAYNGPRQGGAAADIQNIHSERGNTDGDITTVKNSSKVDIGGNGLTSMLAMSRWTGLGEESLDESMAYDVEKTYAYDEMGAIPNELAFRDSVHFTNGYMIPLANRDDVKRAITEHGSCGVDVYWSSAYVTTKDSKYDALKYKVGGEEKFCMYNNVNITRNHAVSVVGWDDAFPRFYFCNTRHNMALIYTYAQEHPDFDIQDIESYPDLTATLALPEQDGAWLIKNSYGTDNGDQGYVWISYENMSFADVEGKAVQTAKVFEFDDEDNYDHIYQYDGTVGTKAFSASLAAVRYHTGPDTYEQLEAAGIALNTAAVSYTIRIYTDLTDPSDPTSGTEVHTQSGTTGYAGYYTIPLTESVLLRPDSDYSIVWDFSGTAGTVYIYADASFDESGSPYRIYSAAIHPKETFYYKKSTAAWIDGADRKDASDQPSPIGYRLKAYTSDLREQIDLKEKEDLLQYGDDELYCVYGTSEVPETTIALEGIMLVKDRDYTLAYYPESADPETDDPIQTPVASGTYTMVINGMGAFKGMVITPVHLLVVPRSLVTAIVTVVSQEYDPAGDYHPVSAVRLGETLLQEERDYSCEVSAEGMTGTVIVSGTGNYSGTLSRSFKINGAIDIAKATVSAIPNYYYNGGSEIRPEPVIHCKTGTRLEDLDPGTDYDLEYADNINAGTAKITIIGKGRYCGTKTVTFKIVPYPYSAGSYIRITYADLEGTVPVAQYTKSGARPEVSITFEREIDGTPVVLEELTEGVDYTRTFANNLAVTTEQTRKKPSVTVKFKGNYKGSVPAQNFIIQDNNRLADEVKSVTVADQVAGKKAGSWKSVPEIIDKNGKKLTIGKDCLVYYYYTEETVLPDGTVREADSVVMPKDVVPSGTVIGLRIGPLNYSGESLSYKKEPWKQSLVYRIVDRSISRAGVRVTAQTYPAIMPEEGVIITAADLLVKYGRDDLTFSEDGVNGDYEIVAGSFANNRQAGTASFLIRGLNDYGGTKKVSFRILPRALDNAEVTVSAADSPYRKGGVTVPVTVISNAGRAGEKILVEGIDYTVSYSNNKTVRGKDEQRPPTVKIKGKGSYKGTLSATFSIVRQDLTEMLHAGGKSSAAAPDRKYSLKQNAWKSTPVLKDVNGKALSKTDFTVTDYVYAETTYIGNRKYPQGTSIDPVNGLEIGTKISIQIEGLGTYQGNCICTYTIVQ